MLPSFAKVGAGFATERTKIVNASGPDVTAEAAVIGAGPAGLVSAIALATARVETMLIAPVAKADQRTTALLAGSVTALATLGVWPNCLATAAPLRKIRIVDDTRRLFRAPEIVFDAAEIGLEAFGYNIENRYLLAALETRAAELNLTRIASPALAIRPDASGMTIKLSDREVRVHLVVGADGQRSLCRTAAQIDSSRREYPQSALTLNLSHARPHHDISTEFHTEHGPFTLVPLPGQRSSLVWVSDPENIGELAAKNDAQLAAEIERRAHSILGAMSVESGRSTFPLAVETADQLARGRTALVGEAAHVLPPIGAQGLNLGLRDAAAIAEVTADAWRQNTDIGAPEVMSRYGAARAADVKSCTLAVDLLNRSLLSDFVPLQATRGFSLYLLDRVAMVRRALMRQGVAPATVSQPRLMRGQAV
jgi:2-octaprenyl-6-methoxyphenol hydroxylase